MSVKNILKFSAVIGLSCIMFSAAYAAPTLVPHRSIYKLHIRSAKPTGEILSGDGQLLYSLSDSCTGWANEQKLEMRYYLGTDDVIDSTVINSSWEAKDGSRYQFFARTLHNGLEQSRFMGEAENAHKTLQAQYRIPAGKNIVLSDPTLFPLQHTLKIIETAQQNKKILSSTVFDGTDEAGYSRVGVFISNATNKLPSGLNAKLQENPLLQGKAWPVRLAFYAPYANPDEKDKDLSVPEYEIMLEMLPSGIVRSMAVDYGDYIVQGDLQEIERLKPSGC